MANTTPQKANAKKNPPVESTNSTSKEPIANNTPPIEPDDDDIGELFTIVGGYISSGGLERLKKLKNDNEKLKEETVHLRATNKENLGAYSENYDAWKTEKTGFTRQLQEKEKADNDLRAERNTNSQLKDHIKGLEDRVLELLKRTKTDESQINRLTALNTQHGETLDRERDDRIHLQDDLKATAEQLDAKTRELTSAEESLEVVRAFLVQLSPLDKKRAQIREALADMFNGALDYFQQTLGQDIESGHLMRSNSQVHPPSLHSLPLPTSNTPAAKQMRVVAGLMAYGRALVSNVFRPTYVTQNHKLDGVLHQTAAQNPQQAACIRAVLLKAIPERQRQNQEGCVDLVVEEVLVAIGHWVQNEQAFKSGLKQVCERASTTWALIQLVEERIWPDFNFHLPEDWRTLPSSLFQPTSAPKPSPSRQTQPQKKTQERQPSAATVSPRSSTLSAGEVARVVWPAFIADDPQGPEDTSSAVQELVYHGYVLTQVQMKGAENEISEASQRAGPRPTRRADPTATRKRRDSAVYLSNGNLDGSDSK